jgi:hypothetical protein
MAGRILAFLTVFLLGTATATRADGVDLTLPDGYVTADASWLRLKAPVNRMWTRTISGVRHTIVASSTPFSGDLDGVRSRRTVRVRHDPSPRHRHRR